MKEISDKTENWEEGDGFLTSLILSQNMSQAEIYANVSELMLGAVDTVSFLYHLYDMFGDSFCRQGLKITPPIQFSVT